MAEEERPDSIPELAERLFAAVERRTGWHLTEARSTTLELVRDGSGVTVFLKGKYAGRDLGEPPLRPRGC